MWTTVPAIDTAPVRVGKLSEGVNADTVTVTPPLPDPLIRSTDTNGDTFVTVHVGVAHVAGVIVTVTPNAPPAIGTVRISGDALN